MMKDSRRWPALFPIAIVAGALFAFGQPDSAFACGPPAPAPLPKPNPPHPPPKCPANNECQICTASPRFVATGNFVADAVDIQIRTAGFPLQVTRRYDSSRPHDGMFGLGWTSNLSTRLYYATYLYAAPSTYKKEALITMPEGVRYRFVENADGVSYTPPVGRYDVLVKNGDGSFDLRLQRSRTRYHFGSTGLLTSMTDEFGNALNLTYDGNGRLSRVADGAGSGRYLDVIFGPDGRVSMVRDSSGREVEYSYAGGNGWLISVTDAAGRESNYEYFQAGSGLLFWKERDRDGRLTKTVEYDNRCRVTDLGEGGESYEYIENYGGAPNRLGKRDSTTVTTVFTFNTDGLITDWEFVEGSTRHTDYYSDGSIQQTIDELGVKTFFTYDWQGSVLSVTRDYQGPEAIKFEYTYDPNYPEKVIQITARNPATGGVNYDWTSWKYDYYQAGSPAPGALFHVRRIKSSGSSEILATYEYNSKGQVTRVTSATGGVTDYQYNAAGDLIQVTAPANNDAGTRPVSLYGHDSLGRVSSVTDALNHVTEYTYDALDRIETVTLPKPVVGSPLDFTTTYSYDNFDPGTGLTFTIVTDPNGKITKQGYDQYGRLIQSVDALNKVTAYGYTGALLTSITDANNNVTTYTYDVRHRLETINFPDGAQERYQYFRDGLVEYRYLRQNWLGFEYDRLKRVKRQTGQGDGAIDYTYTGQKLTSIVDNYPLAGETHTLGYDTSYRLSSSTQGTRGTVSYTYNLDDTVATRTVAGGPTATHAYYPDGSVNTITWSPVAGQFKYRYTLAGQYESVTMPSGLARNYSYDDQGRLTQLSNIDPIAGNLATYAYGYDLNYATAVYDRLGQRVSMTATVPSQSFNNHLTKYEYDSLYQLTKATYPNVAPFNGEVDSWTYDSIGNRLTNTVSGNTQTYTYQKITGNPLNWQRLLSDGSNTYTYHPRGDVLTKSGAGGNFTFGWDERDGLRTITGSATAGYNYDYQRRRSKKTVSGVTTNYLYDGLDLTRETGPATADYLFGPGIDEPLAMRRSSQTYYYVVDGLGSVNLVTNASGVVQNKYLYDAWGQTKSQTGSLGNPFRYTARETAEAGTLFYRARYLQPSVGRFLSEDPIGFQGGMSLYGYVANDPVFDTDPSGLSKRKDRCTTIAANLLGIMREAKHHEGKTYPGRQEICGQLRHYRELFKKYKCQAYYPSIPGQTDRYWKKFCDPPCPQPSPATEPEPATGDEPLPYPEFAPIPVPVMPLPPLPIPGPIPVPVPIPI